MTTDVYPRENCIAPAMVFIVWTTDTTNGRGLAPDMRPHVVYFGELSSLLTVKTLTGMTTDVYPRGNCIAPAIVFIVWTTDTKNGWD